MLPRELLLRCQGVNALKGIPVFIEQTKDNVTTRFNLIDLPDHLAHRVKGNFLTISTTGLFVGAAHCIECEIPLQRHG